MAELNGTEIGVRDSKNPDVVLTFDWGSEWCPFLRSLRIGRYFQT